MTFIFRFRKRNPLSCWCDICQPLFGDFGLTSLKLICVLLLTRDPSSWMNELDRRLLSLHWSTIFRSKMRWRKIVDIVPSKASRERRVNAMGHRDVARSIFGFDHWIIDGFCWVMLCQLHCVGEKDATKMVHCFSLKGLWTQRRDSRSGEDIRKQSRRGPAHAARPGSSRPIQDFPAHPALQIFWAGPGWAVFCSQAGPRWNLDRWMVDGLARSGGTSKVQILLRKWYVLTTLHVVWI